MGRGVAEALIATGHKVVLVDSSEQVATGAREAVLKSLRSAALLSGAGEKPAILIQRLETTTDLSRLFSADLIIENVTEQTEIKAELYPRLEASCRLETIFAANTSTIPISEIAAMVSRPERVIGMHFMNPVRAKYLVEVIRGPATGEAAFATVGQLLAQLGKEMVLVGDGPGFAINRVLMLTINEAIRVVEEGTATAAEVDHLFRGCLGHPMGPLATGDLIGLDTVLLSLTSMQTRRADNRFAPCDLLKSMVAAGKVGRKSGGGFFDY
jgi:3-hydroxybutyryl-CoA dehydrogenase